ncbi:hypothetical protein I5S53_08565 [Pseudomonas juntendi]|uniref:hypothetical protein n=1 Tax=Pseudomonas juntendi TaxID=2666183 RepID=UPI0018D86607|nr:hypothetical protein [Pseudomonas juntendi]MBH3384023.1 hypothetical protein [Pseudomonas juntendi]MDG9918532.1 hypothetical protein [Pseudomonas juntendi]MDH0508132.1 hypothetical protein [Pseudomonas juntendi]MDH1043208.1 hypothetical protein [Pseudomonas juntendi]
MIKQRTPFDCGIASFAAALRLTYEQAMELFAPQADLMGTTAADTANALTQLGIPSSYATFPAFYQHLNRPGNPCAPEVVRGCPAILTILSRNGHGLHAVYWDGQQAHDPDPRYQHPRELNDLVLLEAISIACVFANKSQALCAKSGAVFKGLPE